MSKLIMFKYPRSHDIDLELFSADRDLTARYGLPKEVRFCRKCVVSNQRPNTEIEHSFSGSERKKTINFDETGVCDACRQAERKREIDWGAREQMLFELCDRFRRTDGGYDCLCPGSGGKDSVRAYNLLKNKYNMNPLMATFGQCIVTPVGRRNLERWSQKSGDHVVWYPNGRAYRLLTRLALENLFHPQQPFILGLKNVPPRIAAIHGIKLVFYGEDEAEYGNPIEENNSPIRLTKYFTTTKDEQISLGGVEVEDLVEQYGLKRSDFQMFLPPDAELMQSSEVQVHQLGFYEYWHPQGSFYEAMDQGNLEISPVRQSGTHTKYTSIDDVMDELHYWTYFIKFGIGRATADCSQEIRSGDIVREEAIALVDKYEGEFPEKVIAEICSYLSLDKVENPKAYGLFEQPSMDIDYLRHLADRARSPHLWKYSNDRWFLRNKVTESGAIGGTKAVDWKGNQK